MVVVVVVVMAIDLIERGEAMIRDRPLNCTVAADAWQEPKERP